jgi:hypothetical protein
MLKFFRINHRDEQISKQREGDEGDNNVFHKSLEFFAPAGVQFARHKKKRDDSNENKVSHRFCFKLRARLAGAGHLLNQIVLVHVRTMTQRRRNG